MTSSNTRPAARAGRNRVRIIGGAWRGRRIPFPELPGLRPTPDRVRETLFNWLQQSTAGARCLDLFAGSGALGLEALSRGARAAVFVEQAPAAADALRATVARLDAAARAEVHAVDAEQFLRGSPAPFDIVFLDPPFGRGALAHFLPLLDLGGWVAPGGCVYLESERAAGAPPLPAHWSMLKSKIAGEVGYHLARKEPRG